MYTITLHWGGCKNHNTWLPYLNLKTNPKSSLLSYFYIHNTEHLKMLIHSRCKEMFYKKSMGLYILSIDTVIKQLKLYFPLIISNIRGDGSHCREVGEIAKNRVGGR